MDNKNNTGLVFWISVLCILALIVAGVYLIWQSNDIYRASVTQSESLAKKVLNPSYSLPVTVPAPSYASVKDGYGQALFYFGLAVAIIFLIALLPRIQSFNLSPTGGINITLREIKEQVNDLVKQNNIIQASSTGTGGILSNAQLLDGTILEKAGEDTQKGKWGQQSTRNDRRLVANIMKSSKTGLYKIILTVESTDENRPLKGYVNFHLHESFKNPNPVIFVQDGKAVLRLNKVYGMFTAAAEADDGKTQLELDLVAEAQKTRVKEIDQ